MSSPNKMRSPTSPRSPHLRASGIRSVPRGSTCLAISMADLADDRSSVRRSSRTPSARASRSNSIVGTSSRKSSPNVQATGFFDDQFMSQSPGKLELKLSIKSHRLSGAMPNPPKTGNSKRKSFQKGGRRISIREDVQERDIHQDKLGKDWQMRHEGVTNRIAALFNCWTMSDVVFQIGNRELPAHKFILGAASPVLYNQCFQQIPAQFGGPGNVGVLSGVDDSCTPRSAISGGSFVRREPNAHISSSHVRISIDDVPFDGFFEFLRFIYTDDVMVNLSNVRSLIFLAEKYRVFQVADICFNFLRSEIRGESALKILEILQTLLLKACVGLWRDVVERNQVMNRFQGLNYMERRNTMAALVAASKTGMGSSRLGSRLGSRRSSAAGSRMNSAVNSSRNSLASEGTSNVSGSEVPAIQTMQDELNEELMALELGGEQSTKVSFRQKTQQLYHQMAIVSDELTIKCWRRVSDNTDQVVTCANWVTQPLKIVQAILRVDVCNVPEIALFRALIEWADKRCKFEGLAILPEHRLHVMGGYETVQLIRFPRMTLEQIQWEVVPTGVLSFQDLEQLQSIIATRSLVLGRFNGEARQYPISDMLQQCRRDSGARGHRSQKANRTESADSFQLGPWTAILSDASNEAIEKRLNLTPKTPIYTPKENDEIDAMLASHLLRGHVDRFVDDYVTDLAAAEAGVPTSKGEEQTKTVLLADPVQISIGSDRSRDTNDVHQQATKDLTPMLLYSQNWLAQEMEGRQTEPQNIEQATSVPMSTRILENEVNFTGWGEQPGAQDFKRLTHGIYSFRGNRVLELGVENGETMVYEVENDEDDDDDPCQFSPDFDGDTPEAIREELGLTACNGDRTKVTLSSFLCRQ